MDITINTNKLQEYLDDPMKIVITIVSFLIRVVLSIYLLWLVMYFINDPAEFRVYIVVLAILGIAWR